MNLDELRKKEVGQINGQLIELRKAQFGLRMQVATQQLTNTSQIKSIRRDIARLKTLQTEMGRSK
jgi:large subunit ribosomal protein L29